MDPSSPPPRHSPPPPPGSPLPVGLAALDLSPALLRKGMPIIHATTSDEQPILLRPVLPADKPLFQAGLEQLSAASRHLRFLAGLSQFTARQLSSFTEVDHVDRLCWIALTPDGATGIGVTRSLRLDDPPAAAEIAVTVIDPWQRRGVISRLLAVHALTARDRGIEWFQAEISPANIAVLGLMESIGARQTGPTRWVAPIPAVIEWAVGRFR